MNSDFKNLLSPITIGKTTFKNRLCVAPMGDSGYGHLHDAHGELNEYGIEHIMQRARGGFGIYFLGTLLPDDKVDPCDKSTHFMSFQKDFRKRALRLNELASYYDMKLVQQVSLGLGRNMAGAYSCSENELFGNPSATTPVLTKEQIKIKIERLVDAAVLMKSSGFTGVEIHALHWGYLLDQFAMSLTNRRDDEYGGTLENRLRVCKEIVEGVKQSCGQDFPVFMRLGLKSYISGLNKTNYTGENEAGRTLEEGIRISKLLEEYGYDALSVDVGQYDTFYHASAPMYIPQGHVIPLAAKVKEVVKIPVLCGSRMNDPYMSEKALAEGKIDGVVLGRPTLADPHYAKKLEMGRPEKIRPCIGCNVGCMGNMFTGTHVGCAVNPALRKEVHYGIQKAMVSKKVAVVGGGLAGMEFARIAKMRGHDVAIYEKTDRLGGLLKTAGSHVFKKEVLELLEWYKSEITDLGIPVSFNSETGVGQIREMAPDAVVLAVGSKPLLPPITGIDHPKSISCVDFLNNKVDPGENVVVVGGGLVGCETAIDLAMEGKKVTLVEAADAVLGASKMISIMVRQIIPDMLEHYKVNVMAGHKIEAVNDKGAVVVPMKGGDPVQVEADKVILSIGMKSLPGMEKELFGSGIEVFSVGDGNIVGNVYTAIASAYDAARRL